MVFARKFGNVSIIEAKHFERPCSKPGSKQGFARPCREASSPLKCQQVARDSRLAGVYITGSLCSLEKRFLRSNRRLSGAF